MDAKDNVGRQILLNASRSVTCEHEAFKYLRSRGLNEKEIIMALRRVGVFTKIRIHKKD